MKGAEQLARSRRRLGREGGRGRAGRRDRRTDGQGRSPPPAQGEPRPAPPRPAAPRWLRGAQEGPSVSVCVCVREHP